MGKTSRLRAGLAAAVLAGGTTLGIAATAAPALAGPGPSPTIAPTIAPSSANTDSHGHTPYATVHGNTITLHDGARQLTVTTDPDPESHGNTITLHDGARQTTVTDKELEESEGSAPEVGAPHVPSWASCAVDLASLATLLLAPEYKVPATGIAILGQEFSTWGTWNNVITKRSLATIVGDLVPGSSCINVLLEIDPHPYFADGGTRFTDD